MVELTEETVDHRLERNSPPKPQKPHGGATTLSSISNVTRFYLIPRIPSDPSRAGGFSILLLLIRTSFPISSLEIRQVSYFPS